MSKRKKAQPEHRFLQVFCILLLLALLAVMLTLEIKRSTSTIGREGAKAADFTYVDRLEGFVFRSEATVTDGSKNGVLQFLVEDGATVAAGESVLNAYEISREQDERERAAALYAEIKLLEQSLSADDAWQKEYLASYQKVMEAVSSGDWRESAQAAQSFSETLRQSGVAVGGNADAIRARIAELRQEIDGLVEHAGEPKSVSAAISGRFFTHTDGYEAIFGLSECAALTPERLSDLLKKSNADPRTVGKIADDGRFYLAVPVTAAQAAGYTAGELYSVRMSRGGSCEMLLERVAYAASGDEALLMLTADAMPEGMDPARRQSVEIARKTVSGISVPETALCFEGEKPYVYVIEGGVAARRSVEILCRENGCCIVASRDEAGWLRVGERVLLRAAENSVFEGMVLNK